MHRARLFIASCCALVAVAVTFAVRGDILTDLETLFHLTDVQKGLIAGAAFWSFGSVILFGGPLVDFIGMGRLLRVAAACHILGAILTILAPNFYLLFLATLVVGAGNGLVEAVCNPLVAAMYPEEKTHKLTVFHAWFPGGIVIGGLICALLSHLGVAGELGKSVSTLAGLSLWQIKMGLILIPAVVYFLMLMGQKFPPTERVAAGLSFSEMIHGALSRPLFWIVFLMMWFTAATELVPGAWIKNTYDHIMGVAGDKVSGAGILFLVWGSGLMWVMRQFFSKQASRLSPVALITVTAPLAAIGLALFPFGGTSKPLFFLSTTLLYVGVCFWWPRMLGIANERCPKSGALGLAIVGAAGNFSTAIMNPVFGLVVANAGGEAKALQIWAILPATICVVFLLVHLYDMSRGGYKAEKLATKE